MKSEGKIERFYLSGIVSKTVAKAQMVNWATVLNEYDIKTTFIVFCSKEKKNKALEMFNAEDNYIIITYPAFNIFRQLFIITNIYKLIKLSVNRKPIIQTRNVSFAYALTVLKALTGVPIIYDVRGAGENDYNKNTSFNLKSFIKGANYQLKRKLLYKFSSKIFCVSNQLKNYLIANYNLESKKNKFEVFYGAANEKDFFFSPGIRANYRKKYGLDNKIVILYSGMLNKPWQVPGKIIELFLHLINDNANYHLFLLTPDIEISAKLKEFYHIEDADITILESDYSELNAFLNAADYGLLLRENKLVNNVSAPTKFSEYLLTGLPVIISRTIGDYGEYIARTGYGIVIDDLENFSNIKDVYSGKDVVSFRNEISSDAKTNYSKTIYIKKLTDIYSSL